MKKTSDMLLNSASTPLYLQLEQMLYSAIEQGHYPPGSKLPTESELSNYYHVSRVTVRKALKLLESKKCIDRKVGKGTYVAEKKLQRTFTGNVRSFTLMCQETGMKPSARLTQRCWIAPSEDLQTSMHLRSDQQVLLIERIRYADDQPVMIERDYFSEEFRFLLTEDLEHHSLYELIREKMHLSFTTASRQIDIVFSNASEARMLGLKTGYPLLRIFSTTENEDGTAVTYSEQLCIGDKFRLRV